MIRGARSRRGAWLLAAMGPLAAGCSSSSFDVASAGDDASVDGTSADASAGDTGGSDDAHPEAGDTANDAPPDGCACEPGLVCSEAGLCCKSGLPVTAFEASPTPGNVCNPLAILTTDGKVAGLDDLPASAGTIDGQSVTGCIAVDFGEALSLDPVIVRAAAAGNACSVSACSTECGNGDEFRVFRGTTKGSYTFVSLTTLKTDTLEDYSFTFGGPARFAVVCRSGNGLGRDDVVVDSVRSGNTCPK